ncbi:unnamed protein product, partial [Staurois parvus]
MQDPGFSNTLGTGVHIDTLWHTACNWHRNHTAFLWKSHIV